MGSCRVGFEGLAIQSQPLDGNIPRHPTNRSPSMGIFRVILACFCCLIALVQPSSAYKLVYSVLDASSKENALDAHGARGVYDLYSAKRARDTAWAESRKTLERTQGHDGKALTSSKRKRKEEYRGDEVRPRC
jgi:hypothetical protein